MTRLPLLAQQLNSLRPRSQTLVVFFFFFQAEDGIRDVAVTGFRRVLFRSLRPATCFRPLRPSGASFQMIAQAGGADESKLPDEEKPVSKIHEIQRKKFEQEDSSYQRSEERRVGKECRARRCTKSKKEK